MTSVEVFSTWTFYEYLMRSSSLQLETVWLYSYSQYLQSLPHIQYVCISNMQTQAIKKKIVSENISSPLLLT